MLSGRRHSSDSCVSFRLLFEEKQIKTAARLFRMQTFTDPHCNNIDEIFFYSHVLLSRHCRTPTPQVRVIGRCMINFNCSAAYLQADFATTIQEFSLNTHHVRVVARMARTQSSDESGWATKYLLRDVIRQQNGRRGSSKSIGYSEKCTIRW